MGTNKRISNYFKLAITKSYKFAYLRDYCDWLESLQEYDKVVIILKYILKKRSIDEKFSSDITNDALCSLHSQYSRSLEKLHNLEDASKHMKLSLDFSDYKKPLVIDKYLQTLFNLRKFKESIEILNKLMSINKLNPDYLYFYSRYYFEKGENFKCSKYLILALQKLCFFFILLFL